MHGVFLDAYDEYPQWLNEEDRDIDKVNWLQPKIEQVELFKSRIPEWFENNSIKQERSSLSVKSAGHPGILLLVP